MEDTQNPTPVPQNTEDTARVNMESDTTNNQDTEGNDTISTPIRKDDEYMLPNITASAQHTGSQLVCMNMENEDYFEQPYAKETARSTEQRDSVIDQPQETHIMHPTESAKDLSPQTPQISTRPQAQNGQRNCKHRKTAVCNATGQESIVNTNKPAHTWIAVPFYLAPNTLSHSPQL
jgi:hypothetical protein